MAARLARIDHVQIAAPRGGEQAAREFCAAILGLKEIEKPPLLAALGGCWLDCGSQQVHIGVERDFRPPRKAHPAFAVAGLDEWREGLAERGIEVLTDESIPGTPPFYVEDSWGNRLEFVEAPV